MKIGMAERSDAAGSCSALTRWRGRPLTWALALSLGLGLAALAGCQQRRSNAPPPPAFSGPAFLHGTVGSLARLQGYQPTFVSGFGLVVDLEGTGSSQAPRAGGLRERLLQEIRARGYGQSSFGTRNLSPRMVLESSSTAVVMVEGIIPAGSVRGDPFDVLVTALPQTDTTSLRGGRLFSVNLTETGGDLTGTFSTPLAVARGDVYIYPADLEERSSRERITHERTGAILAGGQVTYRPRLRLILSQPSWDRSRMIADRINEKFGRGRADRDETAVARTDAIVDLAVPQRFAGRSEDFLALVQHLYIQRGIDFEPEQARMLGRVLAENPAQANRVTLTWEALGRTALPSIRNYYVHDNRTVRMAALAAGARLNDEIAVGHLTTMSRSAELDDRIRAARLLGRLQDSVRAEAALQDLVDDESIPVRIAAYESLRDAGSALVQRTPIGVSSTYKFSLDHVDAEKPLIYVSQRGYPRIVVFNPFTGFRQPMISRIWDGQLILRATEEDDNVVNVFYQDRFGDSEIFRIRPTVGNLVFLLAHTPHFNERRNGLDLSYGHAVSALMTLQKQGVIEAPIEIQESPLASMVRQYRDARSSEQRPEFADLDMDMELTRPIDPGDRRAAELNLPSPGVGPEAMDDVDAAEQDEQPVISGPDFTPTRRRDSTLPGAPMPGGVRPAFGDDPDEEADRPPSDVSLLP